MLQNEIKSWLKAIGKNREWLAEQTGSKLKTVNNWLSSTRGIPSTAQRLVTKLMTQYPTDGATQSPGEDNTLTLSVDAATFDLWNASATRENKLLRQWALDILTEHAGESRSKKQESRR